MNSNSYSKSIYNKVLYLIIILIYVLIFNRTRAFHKAYLVHGVALIFQVTNKYTNPRKTACERNDVKQNMKTAIKQEKNVKKKRRKKKKEKKYNNQNSRCSVCCISFGVSFFFT